jgi:hypothetical protein
MTAKIGSTYDASLDEVRVLVMDGKVEVEETTEYDDPDFGDVYTTYTPSQARVLAALLTEAAEVAEAGG